MLGKDFKSGGTSEYIFFFKTIKCNNIRYFWYATGKNKSPGLVKSNCFYSTHIFKKFSSFLSKPLF